MKKRIKYIITGFAVIVCCFLYSHIDKTHNIYDVKEDSDTYIGVNLGRDDLVTQEFLCLEENLDGISIKVSVNSDSTTGGLTYALYDSDKKEVQRDIVTFENLKSGKMNKVKFNKRVEESKGKLYTIEIGVENIEEGEGIEIYYEPKDVKKDLYISNEKIDGCLILRTITHRFDMETFIVTLGFVMYLSVFFRILYKLFS